ncbi:hypothetical protein [Shinella sp.]|uniref:hypothetical protein n=1 Tax=Shinella sp. TaxID=1870904 RepID=UPI00258BAA15|nr:hypothetical protein [Shinella sp.]MCW5711288.1 hypothetical protein [Shinella sp.]
MNLFWTDERVEQLRKMREVKLSYEQIALAMGVTVGSVKSAWTRYVNGKRPEADRERKRSAERREQISAWEKANRERVNAGKRRRRAQSGKSGT